MRYVYATSIFLVAYLLQTTLMNVFRVFDVTPNLLLCLVVVFSYLYDDTNIGLILGVVFGLLYDISFSQYVGIAALAFFIISLTTMLVSAVMTKEAVFSIVILGASATVVYTLIYWLVMAMLGSNYNFLFVLGFLPYYVVYNTIVVVIMYYAMIKRVMKRNIDKEFK